MLKAHHHSDALPPTKSHFPEMLLPMGMGQEYSNHKCIWKNQRQLKNRTNKTKPNKTEDPSENGTGKQSILLNSNWRSHHFWIPLLVMFFFPDLGFYLFIYICLLGWIWDRMLYSLGWFLVGSYKHVLPLPLFAFYSLCYLGSKTRPIAVLITVAQSQYISYT